MPPEDAELKRDLIKIHERLASMETVNKNQTDILQEVKESLKHLPCTECNADLALLKERTKWLTRGFWGSMTTIIGTIIALAWDKILAFII
jgi:hypothetical protein